MAWTNNYKSKRNLRRRNKYCIYEKLFSEELEMKVPQHSRWDYEIWLKSEDLPF
ncbi:uncharacterized protein FFNC_03072 [Fusarium fujikuroi]|nr:uncharacterized protein FFNC_03072 [Fusarium fujikuroi]